MRPSASNHLLQQRAQLLKATRLFFEMRSVMEVDVPCLGASTVTDPHIDSFKTAWDQRDLYLQTSPEYFMKRLLASGCDAIYYLGKAFRIDELGVNHNPEFTMLEWYRPGFSEHDLIAEVIALLEYLGGDFKVVRYSYQEVFERVTGLNPHLASNAELARYAKGTLNVNWKHEERDFWLNLIFSHCIEPRLSSSAVTIVFDFPVCQAALAQLAYDDSGVEIARRFEIYWKGVELANGYFELVDENEQRQRFIDDRQKREQLGKAPIEMDEKFLSSIAHGIPECAGVALGFDRLLMCISGESKLENVMPFAFPNL